MPYGETVFYRCNSFFFSNLLFDDESYSRACKSPTSRDLDREKSNDLERKTWRRGIIVRNCRPTLLLSGERAYCLRYEYSVDLRVRLEKLQTTVCIVEGDRYSSRNYPWYSSVGRNADTISLFLSLVAGSLASLRRRSRDSPCIIYVSRITLRCNGNLYRPR